MGADLHIHYAHYDCSVDSGVEWTDTWESAVDGECPACGTENIVAVSWHPEDEECGADGWGEPPAEAMKAAEAEAEALYEQDGTLLSRSEVMAIAQDLARTTPS